MAQTRTGRIAARVAARRRVTDPGLARLFQRLPSVICLLRGPEHTYEFANDAHHRLVGQREVIGRTMREALPEFEPQGVFERLDRVYASGEPLIAHACPLSVPAGPNGTLVARLLDVVYQPVTDAAGRVCGIFIEGSDVTDAACAAASLKAANHQLEQRVSALNVELAALRADMRDQMREHAEAVQTLGESRKLDAVGQLTGAIAHDFNNVLQGISGSLELMRHLAQSGNVAAVARHAGSAVQAVERAATLTHRLLAFARRQALQPSALHVGSLVAGLAERLGRAAGPGIALELDLQDGDWSVLCDPGQLEAALLDLAVNARDAMPRGGRLRLVTRRHVLSVTAMSGWSEARPGDYVELSVVDTGCGMDDATRSRAFEPFFTTKAAGQATGLGLSQLYGFIGQSGGFTRIDSAEGQGTTIRLYLRRHQAPRTPHPPPNPAPLRPTSLSDLAGTGRTVLLLEDEEQVRRTAAQRLRALGYRVLEAVDGAAALALLECDERIDALVADLGLPGELDSRGVADAARARRPSLPVLFITGQREPGAELPLAPGTEVIGKPLALDHLAARLRALLDGDLKV